MRDIESIFKEIESVPDFSGHTISSVTYKNGNGDTPLHIVSNCGDVEAIEILVKAGADVNAKGETGYTSLHCAAEQNKPEAIVKLLALGATIVKDDNGETPYSLALLLNNSEAINVLAKST